MKDFSKDGLFMTMKIEKNKLARKKNLKDKWKKTLIYTLPRALLEN